MYEVTLTIGAVALLFILFSQVGRVFVGALMAIVLVACGMIAAPWALLSGPPPAWLGEIATMAFVLLVAALILGLEET